MRKRVRKSPVAKHAPDSPLPTSQRRSQDTLERLLTAAEDALREEGPDGATLRGIADRAGVSIGIVYRRFPDKDTILRAVYIRFFERSAARNREGLASPHWQQLTLPTIVRLLIEGIVAGYRSNQPLLRALILYARTHNDPDFKRRAQALNATALEGVATLLESRSAEIDHPSPNMAIRFAMTSVAAVLQEHVVFEAAGATSSIDRQQLVTETTRLFLRYLGIR
jgi:AcrR family transcriptional regulator